MSKINKSSRLIGSGILLAFTSSLCCILPLFAILGTAGSFVSVFSWIAPVRPYLLAATAIVLLTAFYQAYKPETKDDCDCSVQKTGMQSKTFLWITTLLSITLATFPYYVSYFQKDVLPEKTVQNTNVRKAVLHIRGMSCASCEGHINHSLQGKPGVKEVNTYYNKGISIVKFDSTQTSVAELATTIEKETGYKITKNTK